MLSDLCRHQQQQVTDEMDVTNMKEYMKVRITSILSVTGDSEWTVLFVTILTKFSAGLDESPAYVGGRENYWRELTLDGRFVL